MPSLKTILVWGSPGDTSEDLTTFQDVSRSACEIISEGARMLGLAAKQSELRIFVFRESPDRPVTELIDDLGRAPRVAHLAVPTGFASLLLGAQQQLALSRISDVLRSMAEESGWDQDVPRQLVDRVGEARFVFAWQSSPKTSPDRRHKAVVRAQLDEGGVGHAAIVVLTTNGAVVAESSAVQLRPTVEEFIRAGKSLSWADRSQVRCQPVGTLEIAG